MSHILSRGRDYLDDLRGLGLEGLPLLPEAGPPGITARWLGTAGLLLSDGHSRLLVDPFASRPGLLAVGTARRLEPRRELVARLARELGPVDAVIVGHSHYDHSMDAPLFAAELDAPLLGSESTAMVARGAGLPERLLRVVRPGDTARFGDFTLRFLDSAHGPALFGRVPYPGEIREPLRPPARARDYRVGQVFALHFAHPLGNALHMGSAGWKPGTFEPLHREGVGTHTLFLCLAGRGPTEELLEHTFRAAGARRLVPIHWDHFFAPLDAPLRPLWGVGLRRFREELARHPEVELRWLPLVEERLLFADGD